MLLDFFVVTFLFSEKNKIIRYDLDIYIEIT